MYSIRPTRLDHVALWVADRDTLAAFLCGYLGMHVIERTDDFTLVGADARLGKLTLFAAEGPREPGALRRIVLRVTDLEGALAALPEGLPVERSDAEVVGFEGPERLGLGLTRGDATTDYDIDHVALAVPDPERTGRELRELGFDQLDGRLAVADKHIRLEPGPGEGASGRPLLNHLALLVDSAEVLRHEADRRGLPVARVVDAPNTFAVFVRGPAGIELEYVEHKPGFALT
jgi:catechol 2,3-dioxygenase-like lactoylglutathione lyase family enzyme